MSGAHNVKLSRLEASRRHAGKFDEICGNSGIGRLTITIIFLHSRCRHDAVTVCPLLVHDVLDVVPQAQLLYGYKAPI